MISKQKCFFALFFLTYAVLSCAQVNRSEDAQKVLNYIDCLSGEVFNGVIIGQNLGHGPEIKTKYDQYIEQLYQETGKYVGMIGLDYEFIDEYSVETLKESNQYLIDYWQKGGLIEINMTPKCPYVEGGNVFNSVGNDLEALIDSNTTRMCVRTGYEDLTVYDYWIGKLDRIAEALTQLRDSGVVVLWRPMQEPNGDHSFSFWYSKAYNSKEDFIALYQHMHDYFTNVKGLNNLLWIYSPIGGGNEWGYAGEEYVDIVAGTTYSGDLTIWGYPQTYYYDKPVGMGEYGHKIDDSPGNFDMRKYIEKIRNNYPRLAFWISWHSWNANNQMAIIHNEHYDELMNDPGVITLDELTWKENNFPPDVAIMNPVDNDTIAISRESSLVFEIEAQDCNGSVSKVELFKVSTTDTTLIGFDETAPYEITFEEPKDGVYSIVAAATDDIGAVNFTYPITIVIDDVTGINRNRNSDIRIYPNPASDFIHLEIKNSSFNMSTWEITDIQNRIMASGRITPGISNGKRIDIKKLKPGLYLLNLRSRDEVRVSRLLITDHNK
jgi:mannan endo-1,4-beta-mannosidase